MTSGAARPPLVVQELGTVDYQDALGRQHALAGQRAAGVIDDTLLLLEHPPVFTLGRRRSARDNVLFPGDTPVVEVERGGDVTWHGPGQLVGYPILALRPGVGEDRGERDLHLVLRRLEDAMIALLAACELNGERRPGHTGVWCRGVKLVSLGVAVRSWVTFHGFAVNVDCDLGWFGRINPCGMSAAVMGSIASVGGTVLPPSELRAVAAAVVSEAFGRRLVAGTAPS